MRRRATTAALAASLSVTGSGLAGATAAAAELTAKPPTDVRVETVLRKFEAFGLEGDTLSALPINALSAHQLASLYDAGLLGVQSPAREEALARLCALNRSRAPAGAAASVLRLEMLGATTVVDLNNRPVAYQPPDELQAGLLDDVLQHRRLDDAVLSGDAAATKIFRSISNMATPELFSDYDDQLFDLARLFSGRTPPVLFRDAGAYVATLNKIAIDDDHAAAITAIKSRIISSGLVVFDRMFTEDAPEDVFLEAGASLDALDALVEGDDETRLEHLRASVVASGQSMLKRINLAGTHLSSSDVRAMRADIARLAATS